LGPGARLKATDSRNLPKPVKMTLRAKDKVAKSPDELLKWIKDLNPWLHTEHSHKTVKKTRYKIFTGLTQGTVKVPERS
jgi:hypothetical protein